MIKFSLRQLRIMVLQTQYTNKDDNFYLQITTIAFQI